MKEYEHRQLVCEHECKVGEKYVLPQAQAFGLSWSSTREEATEYERGMEAARQHAAAQEAVASASQYYPSFTYGYQPGGPWY